MRKGRLDKPAVLVACNAAAAAASAASSAALAAAIASFVAFVKSADGAPGGAPGGMGGPPGRPADADGTPPDKFEREFLLGLMDRGCAKSFLSAVGVLRGGMGGGGPRPGFGPG